MKGKCHSRKELRHSLTASSQRLDEKRCQSREKKNPLRMYTFWVAFTNPETGEEQPSKKELPFNGVRYLATSIGFDLDFDMKRYGWLLDFMLGEELPFGWSREIDSNGEILYYNAVKRFSTKKHPCWLEFRRIFADAILKVTSFERDKVSHRRGGARERQEDEELTWEERQNQIRKKFKLMIERTRVKAEAKNLVRLKSEVLAEALDFYERLIGEDVEEPPLFIQTCPIYMMVTPEELILLAKTFRISVADEVYLLWVPRMVRCLPLPPLWCRVKDEGTEQILFRDLQTGIDLEYHPADLFGCKVIDSLRRKSRHVRPHSSQLLFYDSLMRQYNCDVRTLKMLQKKRVGGISHRVRSLQASAGVAAVFDELAHERRMADLVQLYSHSLEASVLEMKLSDKELFTIFSQLRLDPFRDLQHLDAISEVVLRKRSELPAVPSRAGSAKPLNSRHSHAGSESTKRSPLRKGEERDDGLSEFRDDGLWEFRESDEGVNYWVSMASGRISYTCPFLQDIRQQVLERQEAVKKTLDQVVQKRLNLDVLPPSRRVPVYLKIKEASVELIRKLLQDYENREKGGGRRERGEGSDNEKEQGQSSPSEERKSAVLEKKLTRFTDTDQDASSFQVSGGQHQKEEPSKEKSLPWERADIEKVFDFEKFKNEHGIECVSNQDLLSLMFSWPFTTPNSIDSQMPFSPDQISLIRDREGHTIGIRPPGDLKFGRANTISHRSDLLKAFSRGLHSGDPRFANNEVFSSLRHSLHAAVSSADQHLFEGGLAESRRALLGKEIVVNETSLLRKLMSSEFIEKVRKKIALLSGPSSLRHQKSLDCLSSLLKSKPQSPQHQNSIREAAGDSNISDMLTKLIWEQEGHQGEISEEEDQQSPLPINPDCQEREELKEESKQRGGSNEGSEKGQSQKREALFSEQFYRDFDEVQRLEPGLKNGSPKEINLTRSFVSDSFGAQSDSNDTPSEKVEPAPSPKKRKSGRKSDKERESRSGQRQEQKSKNSRHGSSTPRKLSTFAQRFSPNRFGGVGGGVSSAERKEYEGSHEKRIGTESAVSSAMDVRLVHKYQHSSRPQTKESWGGWSRGNNTFYKSKPLGWKKEAKVMEIEMLNDREGEYRSDIEGDDSLSLSMTSQESDSEFERFAKKVFLQMARIFGDPLGPKSSLHLKNPKPNVSTKTINFMGQKLGISINEEPDLMWIAQQAVLVSPLPRTFQLTRNFLQLNTHQYDRKLSKIGYEYFRCLLGAQRKLRSQAFQCLDPEQKEDFIVRNSWVSLLHPHTFQKYFYNFATDEYSLYPYLEPSSSPKKDSYKSDGLAALRAFLQQQQRECKELLPRSLSMHRLVRKKKRPQSPILPSEFSLANAVPGRLQLTKKPSRPSSSTRVTNAGSYTSQRNLSAQRKEQRKLQSSKLEGVFQIGRPVVASKFKNRLARLPNSSESLHSLIASTHFTSGHHSKDKTLARRSHQSRNTGSYRYEQPSFKTACKELLHKNLSQELQTQIASARAFESSPEKVNENLPLQSARQGGVGNDFKRVRTPSTLVKRAKHAFKYAKDSGLPGVTEKTQASRRNYLVNKREKAKSTLFAKDSRSYLLNEI